MGTTLTFGHEDTCLCDSTDPVRVSLVPISEEERGVKLTLMSTDGRGTHVSEDTLNPVVSDDDRITVSAVTCPADKGDGG